MLPKKAVFLLLLMVLWNMHRDKLDWAVSLVLLRALWAAVTFTPHLVGEAEPQHGAKWTEDVETCFSDQLATLVSIETLTL